MHLPWLAERHLLTAFVNNPMVFMENLWSHTQSCCSSDGRSSNRTWLSFCQAQFDQKIYEKGNGV